MSALIVLILLILWNLSPTLLLIVLYYNKYKGSKIRNSKIPREVNFGFVFSVIGTAGFTILMIMSLFAGGDPQAPIGFLFIPLVGFLVAGIMYAVGRSGALLYCYFLTKNGSIEKASGRERRNIVASVLVLIGAMILVALVSYRLAPYGKAESTSISVKELRTLYSRASRVDDYHMLMRLAQNPKTPPDILRQLSENRNSSVSYRVARNPSAPLDVLQNFSSHSDWIVRSYLPGNPSTPKELLEKLATDEHEFVRRRAKNRLSGGVPDSPPTKLGTFNNLLDLLFD